MWSRLARIVEIGLVAVLTTACGAGALLTIPALQIFVADQINHRIVRINDMTGAGWTTFGTFGSGVNQFNIPFGIFVK